MNSNAMSILLLAAIFRMAVDASIAAAAVSRNATSPPPLPPCGESHTVGDSAGWFFDGAANASVANYTAWASNQSFFLGDYISFNTNTDNTVVHTINATIYKLCGGGGSGSATGCGGCGGWKQPEGKFLAVMLTSEGANYFFSDAGNGDHCRRGMRFEIVTAHGRGLPPVPPEYYEPLSGAPDRRRGEVVFMWVVVLGVGIALILVL